MTGQQVEITHERQLRALVGQVTGKQPAAATMGQQLYAHLRLCACPMQLYHLWSQRQIGRYCYASQFRVPPFAGDYDAQPAWWLDAAAIVATEMAACARCQCSRCAHGGGLNHGA